MGMLRMGMQGVSATILNSRNTRKPLKKIQTPAPVPRNNAPVGSDRLILDLQTECYSIQPSRSTRQSRGGPRPQKQRARRIRSAHPRLANRMLLNPALEEQPQIEGRLLSQTDPAFGDDE